MKRPEEYVGPAAFEVRDAKVGWEVMEHDPRKAMLNLCRDGSAQMWAIRHSELYELRATIDRYLEAWADAMAFEAKARKLRDAEGPSLADALKASLTRRAD